MHHLRLAEISVTQLYLQRPSWRIAHSEKTINAIILTMSFFKVSSNISSEISHGFSNVAKNYTQYNSFAVR
jgi:hypothetical protein